MLKLKEEHTSIRTVILLMIVAYIFSVGMRFIWVDIVSAYPQFYWNNEITLNTNDGYFFAEGARDILAGHHDQYDQSPVDGAPSQLTALLAKVIPVSFETLILYMPSFLSSLIVIPLILIGRAFNQTTMGFIAALIGSIATSYYNRTMTGYYDTDMLSVVLPTFEMYSLILALTYQRNRYLIPITLSIAAYQWWYPQAYAFDTALFLMIIGYALVFDRHNRYIYKVALFILIGILAIPIVSKVSLAIMVFAWFHFQKERSTNLFWPLFALVVAMYFFTGGVDAIWHYIKGYFFRGNGEVVESSLHFFNVMSTVREAGRISFDEFSVRISGHLITFVFACVGYVLALVAYRPLLVTLPLVALGFIAMSAGLRFTIYAVPAMALGIGYFILFITQFIQQSFLRYASVALLTLAILYPNYDHIKNYITPPVLNNDEVAALVDLGKIASSEDYLVGWWDYGFPIRYFANVKTWGDGAQHSGGQNFPISFVFTAKDSTTAANMMRLNTEYMEKNFRDKNNSYSTHFEYMMRQEGFSDPDDFLNALSLPEAKMPPKTRDVYLYLPLRMLEIFQTVSLFSNLNLDSDQKKVQPFYYFTRDFQDTPKTLELGNGLSISKQSSVLQLSGQKVPIKTLYKVGYDQNKVLRINRQNFNSEGLNVIFMETYGQFLVLDDYYLNSTFIQMFVFEHYDTKLFTPVSLSLTTKIYKLKH